MNRTGLWIVGLFSLTGLFACADEVISPPNPGRVPAPGLAIDLFTATPRSVRVGERVTLSWQVSGAAVPTIEIFAAGSRLALLSGAVGSVESDPILSDTLFSIVARANGASAERELRVMAEPTEPRITSFTATPNPAPLGSEVTLAWTTEGAAQVQLFEGRDEIYETTVVQTRRAQRYRLAIVNTFASVEAELVVAAAGYPPVPVESEPNDRVEDADVVEGLIFGEVEDEAAVDWFSVRVPLAGNLTVRFSDGLDGCAVDPTLSVLRGSSELVSVEMRGCQELGTIGDLEGGTYYVVVASDFFSDRKTGPYLLELITSEKSCGDAIVARGEQCDDGAAIDGDGCSAECQLEIEAELGPSGGSVPLTFGGTLGRSRYVALDLTREGQSITATASACGIDRFSLWSALLEFEGSITQSGPNVCLALDPRKFSSFANLSPGGRILEISTSTTAELSLVVTVRVDDPICGNEIVEPSLGEICDDGDLIDGDGCSSLCVFDGPVSLESEPNNSPAVADPTFASVGGGRVTVTGALGSGDIDVFGFEIPAGQTASLLAESYTELGDPGAGCEVPPLISIELLDASGSMIATSTVTQLACAHLEGAALPAGAYYLRVTDSFNSNGGSSYFVDVLLE